MKIVKRILIALLGLFVLLLVGVMLLSEGAHLAHLDLFGYEIHPLEKSTFYFVVVALVIVDIVQGRYQKKINIEVKKKPVMADEIADRH